jgi:hypothetical protein
LVQTREYGWSKQIGEKVPAGRIVVSGYASKQNGLISLQLPNEECPPGLQRGQKANTMGLLLPGYTYKIEKGKFILYGVGPPERLGGISGIDEDGFLLYD